MKKRLLAALLTCVMLFSLLPATAFAEETPDAELEVTAVGAPSAEEGETQLAAPKVKIGDKEYDTLEAAVTAAESGDTIQLGEGKYTLYKKGAVTKGKDLTFVGQGAGKTEWGIGAEVPDPANFGTEFNSDYSFDVRGTEEKETVTFKNMTLQAASKDYLGFSGTDHTIVEGCVINGKTFYWGYESATFRNTTFNCPDGDYALWTYSSPTMTFDNCTFNSSGKVINVYTDYGAGTHDITVNFKDCTVKNTANNKQVLNVNDSNMGDYKYILNISGNNTVSGVPYDKTTCSRLYGFGGKAGNNTGRLDVSIDGTPVWAKGKMLTHEYSAGEQDNAFEVAYGEWSKNPNGTQSREVTKTCKYCSYEETYTETKDAEPIDWDVSKSKTATNLVKQSDGTYTSDVTLSLPAADYEPSVDVVMVIDVSSSMKTLDIAEAKAAATAMCDELAAKTHVDVKVGIVTFDKAAHCLTDGLVDIDTAKAAIDGIAAAEDTNMMAGLIAGKEMLDSGDADEQYLVLMSDGIPIYWVENGEIVSKTYKAYAQDGKTLLLSRPAGSEPEGSKNDFSSMLTVEQLLAATDWDTDNDTWAVISDTGETIANGYKYTNIQKSTYMTAKYLQEEILGRYQLKMVAFGTDKYDNNVVYQYGENFCKWIGEQDGVSYYEVSKPGFGGKVGELTLAFESIADELVQLVDAGSVVIDEIGETSAYNFDFVNDIEKLVLTVGGTRLDTAAIKESLLENETARYGFGAVVGDGDAVTYQFVLHYYKDGTTIDDTEYGECFVWDINVPVTKDATVQLTYTVKLTDPETAPGTYGKYDADGSNNCDGLYTNNSATLYPVDSEGNGNYVPEKFNKPTVSYTVEKPSTPSGGSSGGGSTVLNTDDHYSYIIGYKDGYLRPYGTITRGEVATIFFRLLTDEARDKYWSQTNDYSDCNSDLWCNNAISTLSNMGIIDGYTDGTFRPYGKITRAQFAKIAVGFFETTKKEYQGYYSDVPENAWFTDYVEAASRVGLIQGFEDGTFRPNTNITRAQACVIVNRALNRKPDEDHLLPEKQMVTWPDNNPGDWYYADMQEATNSHDYTWLSKGSEKKYMEDWTKKLEQRNWAAFEHAWSTAHSAPGGEVVK
ncbi:MAG: S-layer homology domain-containing protein [Clostridiales bacterium]|nr:S-layer homology domain-containing protein [Clostridiales bacterium]